MVLPLRALQLAAEAIAALPTGNSSSAYRGDEFAAAIRAFVRALDGVSGAIQVVARYGDFVRQQVCKGTPYAKARDRAVKLLKPIVPKPPAPGSLKPRSVSLRLLENAYLSMSVSHISGKRALIQALLEHGAEPPHATLTSDLYEALLAWRTELDRVVADGTLHHADACSILIEMHRQPQALWDNMLGFEMGKYNAAEIQQAVPWLVEEIVEAAKAGIPAKTKVAKKQRPRRIATAITDARDRWIYEQCCKFVPYETIAIKLNKKPKSWGRIESKQGIRAVAQRYAKRHNLPEIPPRQGL